MERARPRQATPVRDESHWQAPASINYVRAVGVLLLTASVALLSIALLDYLGVINAVAN
jgi:hypothetical protein